MESSNCFQHANPVSVVQPLASNLYESIFSVYCLYQKVGVLQFVHKLCYHLVIFLHSSTTINKICVCFFAEPKSISQSLLISQPPMVRIKINILCVSAVFSSVCTYVCVCDSVQLVPPGPGIPDERQIPVQENRTNRTDNSWESQI